MVEYSSIGIAASRIILLSAMNLIELSTIKMCIEEKVRRFDSFGSSMKILGK